MPLHPESPLALYAPNIVEINEYQIDHACSKAKARAILIKARMARACQEAKTFEDLQPIVQALVSVATIYQG